jgi:predicted lipoprotein
MSSRPESAHEHLATDSKQPQPNNHGPSNLSNKSFRPKSAATHRSKAALSSSDYNNPAVRALNPNQRAQFSLVRDLRPDW